MAEHGGVVGEALYWASTTLFQRLGAHIIAVLLVISGAAAADRDDGRRAARRGRHRASAAPAAGRATIADASAATRDAEPNRLGATPRATRSPISRGEPTEAFETERVSDAEPGTPSRRPRRSPTMDRGRAEAEPDADADRRVPEPSPTPSRRVTASPRMGSRATSTGSRPPTRSTTGRRRPKALERGKARQGPGHRATTRRSAQGLLESLGHFGVEARLVGIVSGPHVSRYELRLAPGTKVSKVTAAQGRPRLRARLDRHPHPRADPRQAGGRRRGPELSAAAWSASATSTAARPKSASPLVAWLGKDIAGHAGLDRPGEDAARARRRHHRLGQVRLRQRDPLLDPDARLAERGRAWCWSTPSRSSSTTTSASRTC